MKFQEGFFTEATNNEVQKRLQAQGEFISEETQICWRSQPAGSEKWCLYQTHS